MPIPRWYLIFGALVLVGAAAADYRGVSFASTSEDRGDPRSIRNNPGSYRSTYYAGRVYYGK